MGVSVLAAIEWYLSLVLPIAGKGALDKVTVMQKIVSKLLQVSRRDRVRQRLENAGFAGEELQLLVRHGRLRSFSAGEFLSRIGGHERGLFLVTGGSMRGSRVDGDSSLITVEPGFFDVIGELSMFGDRHYRVADVIALTEVSAVEFPYETRTLLESAAPRLMEKVESSRSPRRESLAESTYHNRLKAYQGFLEFKNALERRP